MIRNKFGTYRYGLKTRYLRFYHFWSRRGVKWVESVTYKMMKDSAVSFYHGVNIHHDGR